MMNHIDQRLKADIRYCHIPESGILLIVKRGIAFGQSFLDIRWHQEGRPITQIGIKTLKDRYEFLPNQNRRNECNNWECGEAMT